MPALHKVKGVKFEKSFMVLNVDGKTYRIKLSDVSFKLSKAPDKIRNEYKISASGYGIHWPLIDEDLSIDFLRIASLNSDSDG